MHLLPPAASCLRSTRLGATGVLMVLATLPFAVPADAAAPVLTKGLYKGTVVDADGDPDTYAVAIRITAKTLRKNRAAGRVSYRAAENEQTGAYGLDCKGTLKFRSRSGKRFRFIETINGGADAQCVSGGTVTLTRASNRRFTYSWSQAGMDRPAPAGTVTR